MVAPERTLRTVRRVTQIGLRRARDELSGEVAALRDTKRFGLVFEEHLPETVRLPNSEIRRGLLVQHRDNADGPTWTVARVAGTVATLLDRNGVETVADLVVVRTFGRPIRPGLRVLAQIERGTADGPHHLVINAANYHALEMLRFTHAGAVDVIYIDPPYNTGNEFVYNDRRVGADDAFRHSKWLSFMDWRLRLARTLLKPTGDLFASAARRLGDAAAPWLLQHLVGGDEGADITAAKVRIAALAAEAGVRDRLDETAGSLVAEWHRAHRGAVAELQDAVRGKFDTILEATTTPALVSPILPERGWPVKPVDSPDDQWTKHLYAGSDGLYPEVFNTWERRTLAAQVARDEVVAWYRNPSSGKKALAVPYTGDGGAPKTLYPDFLVVRATADGLVVDVLDPHDPSRSDTAPKWAGLAEFAAAHGAQFGKVLAIIDSDDVLVAADLRTPAVGQAFRRAAGEAGVRAVFETHGFLL